MKEIKLCGRGRCCPVLSHVEKDKWMVKDENIRMFFTTEQITNMYKEVMKNG